MSQAFSASSTAAKSITASARRGIHHHHLVLVGGRGSALHPGSDEGQPACPAVSLLQLGEHAQGEQAVLVPEIGADADDQVGVGRKPVRAARGDRRMLDGRERMVHPDVHDAGSVGLDEILGDRVVTRVGREEDHPVGQGECPARQPPVGLPLLERA